MFIGHYGAALAAKRFAPRLSLGATFLAAQLLDVFFCLFVLTGIEKMRIVPGFTEVNAYDLYYLPYTHSLVGALVWSLAAAGVVFAITKRRADAIAFGAVVFSHFVLDVPVHTPDLPLASEASPHLGFGLWRHWQLTVLLELAVFAGGAAMYWRLVVPIGKRRKQLGAFFAVLAVLLVATPFMPTPPSPAVFAVQALFGYFVIAFFAWKSDRPSEWLR